jgi:hypothetical protein
MRSQAMFACLSGAWDGPQPRRSEAGFPAPGWRRPAPANGAGATLALPHPGLVPPSRYPRPSRTSALGRRSARSASSLVWLRASQA